MSDTPSEIDYLLIGHLTADIGPNGERTPGGTASYAARTVHAFGLRAGVLTSAAVGEPLLETLRPYAEVVALPAGQTTTFENVYLPTGRVQYIRGVAGPITAESVPEAWAGVPMVHIGPLAAEGNSLDLLRRFTNATMLVTLQGWLRRWGSDGRVHFRRWYDPEMLNHIDFIVFSEEDIAEDPSMAEDIARDAKHFFLTQAERGGLHYNGGTVRRYSTPQVEVVQPTGAGDVFAAALLCGYHLLGDLERATEIAAALAADCVTRDYLLGCPTPERVRSLLDG